MSGIGHNRGPALGTGSGWARFCWQKARADLFPTLPVEVVRARVRRARAIGLDYRTYAGIRATTGHDLAAFLYSTNVLRMLRDGEAEASRLAQLARAEGISHHLAVPGNQDAARIAQVLDLRGLPVAKVGDMPLATMREGRTRVLLDALRGFDDMTRAGRKVPAGQVLVIGEIAPELDWAATGRMAWALPAERFFSPQGLR